MTFPVWFEKVQEKETVRLESATTWVSTAPNCAPYVFATFFNQNKIVCLQLKLSLYLFLSLWYIFSKYNLDLLRRKWGGFDISQWFGTVVQEEETVRLESATWVSTASNCALDFFPHSFQPKINCLPQVKLSLCLFLCLWYIFSIPFRQNISTSRRALSCDWVNLWASIRIISISLLQHNKQYKQTNKLHLGKY